MKWFLVFWLGPIAFLGGWYGLSYYDINFGYFMLTRQAHDMVLQIYGDTLGIAPASVAPLVAKAIATDSIFVVAILLFRRRDRIRAWWRARSNVDDRFAQRRQSVQRALQNEGCGGRVDTFRPFGTRDVHFKQRPFGRHR